MPKRRIFQCCDLCYFRPVFSSSFVLSISSPVFLTLLFAVGLNKVFRGFCFANVHSCSLSFSCCSGLARLDDCLHATDIPREGKVEEEDSCISSVGGQTDRQTVRKE